MNISKKLFLSAIIIFIFAWFNVDVISVQAKTVITKKAVKKTAVVKKKVISGVTKTSMKWTADGLKALGSPASFGYNYALRNTIIKKIENYARKKKVSVINAKVVNSMDE